MDKEESDRFLDAMLNDEGEKAFEEIVWASTQEALHRKKTRQRAKKVGGITFATLLFASFLLWQANIDVQGPPNIATPKESPSSPKPTQEKPRKVYEHVYTVRGSVEIVRTQRAHAFVVHSKPHHEIITDEELLNFFKGTHILLANQETGLKELVPIQQP